MSTGASAGSSGLSVLSQSLRTVLGEEHDHSNLGELTVGELRSRAEKSSADDKATVTAEAIAYLLLM